MISRSKEDYLRAIYFIQGETGSAQSRQVADYLCMSKSSISQMARKLQYEHLLHFAPYGRLSLTPHGIAIARELTAKHRIIEVFLTDILAVPEDLVHAEAHKLEHAFSNFIMQRLNRFLGNPRQDPHGSIIPEVEFIKTSGG